MKPNCLLVNGRVLRVQSSGEAEDEDVLQELLAKVLPLVSCLGDVEASLFDEGSVLLKSLGELFVGFEPIRGLESVNTAVRRQYNVLEYTSG